jgi:hypothetical protein
MAGNNSSNPLVELICTAKRWLFHLSIFPPPAQPSQMAEMPQIQPSRACKCLNVRVWPQLHPENPPDFLIAAAGGSEYTLTYVGDQGISIVGRSETRPFFFQPIASFFSLQAHPQVTMRTRKIGPPIVDSSRCIRFTTLICLLCQTVVYRVRQLVTSDVDLQEGPLLPSPDWVEQETLLSSCGWVEVYKDCLVSTRLVPVLFQRAISSFALWSHMSAVGVRDGWSSALSADTACLAWDVGVTL